MPISPDSLEGETYRSLRATLAYSRLTEGQRVVLFTSAQRGEGKTTTAVNLAATCAYSERPTLLIDGDLRSPGLATMFRVPEKPGLAGMLAAGSTLGLEAAVRETGIPFLDLLPAGRATGNAPELLARPRLAAMLDEARALYAWVIVDAPPVIPVADALVLSRHVDGVVLVVDVRSTSMSTASRARELLSAVGAPVVGVVANRSKTRETASSYGRYPH